MVDLPSLVLKANCSREIRSRARWSLTAAAIRFLASMRTASLRLRGSPPAASLPASIGKLRKERRKRFRSEEHTSELQSLMRISYAVFCLKKTNIQINSHTKPNNKHKQTKTQHTTHNN